MHALSAYVTKRIALGTALATGVNRSPFEMANAAADIDGISNGRMLLGMGVGAVDWADHFNGNEVDHPLSRIGEYIDVLRMAWDHFSNGESASFEGRFYRFATPPVNPWGLRKLTRPRISVYLGGLRPKMLELAGEKADGVVGYLYTPSFIKSHVLPHVAAGAKRAGRNVADIDVMSLVLCSVSDNRKEAMRRARINVGMYVAYPVGEVIVKHMGLEEDRDAVVKALINKGPAALESTTSDALVQAFSITGTPDECLEQYLAYQGCYLMSFYIRLICHPLPDQIAKMRSAILFGHLHVELSVPYLVESHGSYSAANLSDRS